jgi:hypothetical protein
MLSGLDARDSGAEHDDRHLGEVTVGAQRVRGGRGHRHRADPDPGRGACATAEAQRGAEQCREQRARGALGLGELEGRPQLAHDLALTQHQRFEAHRDAEEMARGVGAVELQGVSVEVRGRLLPRLGHRQRHGVGLVTVRARDPVELGAVAGPDRHRLDPRLLERGEQPGHLGGPEGHALEHVDRSRSVVDRDQLEGVEAGMESGSGFGRSLESGSRAPDLAGVCRSARSQRRSLV